MVGYRKTHNYPRGRPFPLVLLDVPKVILVAVWVFLVPGHWSRAIGVVTILLIIAFISRKLHRRYERTGDAVRIPRPRVVVKFSKGLPGLMLTARIAFFVIVAIMVVFGVAPMAASTARIGIIACVLPLIGVAVLSLALEHHYVGTGRATEVALSVESACRNREQ